jgi:pantoate--beta-alanine ligase
MTAEPLVKAPAVVRTRGTLAKQLLTLRQPLDGRAPTIAFVPTMGALHDGHRALIEHARSLADHVVVSIFVNPLQFGAGEDLDRYPRTFDHDLAVCADEGVELVFAPTAATMYPDEQLVTVHAGPMGDLLEGVHRPGHFDGVLTVVAKLFNLVRPDVAVFGEKDAQQLLLIRRMVADLDLPVHVVGHPTVREPDGLARSSRNAYLSVDERVRALAIPGALDAAESASRSGARAALQAAVDVLAAAKELDVDYLSLVDPETLREVEDAHHGSAVLLVAASVGRTRLIDNRRLEIG